MYDEYGNWVDEDDELGAMDVDEIFEELDLGAVARDHRGGVTRPPVRALPRPAGVPGRTVPTRGVPPRSVPSRVNTRPAGGYGGYQGQTGYNQADIDAIIQRSQQVEDQVAAINRATKKAQLKQAIESKMEAALRSLVGGGAGIGQGLVNLPPERGDTWKTIVPITGSSLAAGATVTISVEPQAFFRFQYLSVPPSQAADVTIGDVKVANVTQLVLSGDLSGEHFPPPTGNSVPDTFQGAWCAPSNKIEVSVTNISGAALTPRFALFGDAARALPAMR